METHDPNAARPAAPPPPVSTAPTGAAVGTTAHAKADLVKRFLAALIDGVLANIVALVLSVGGRGFMYGVGLLIAGGYILVRDGLELDFMDRRSIGKKFMKLRPVRLDGGAMDMNASIRRNWTLALGTLIWGLGYIFGGLSFYLFAGIIGMIAGLAGLLALVEGILVIVDKDGRRIGDKMAETQVVESEA